MYRLRGFTRWTPFWVGAIFILALVLFWVSPGAAAAPPGVPALGITPTPTPALVATPTPTPRPSLSDCDLVIRKRADPTTVRPGDQVVFTIEVKNEGQKACDQTIVIDNIPEELEIEDVDTTQGTWRREGQKVIIEIGLVGQDFTVIIRIYTRVREGTPAGSIENVAVVDSIGLPGPRESDPARIDIITGPGCDPMITKRAEPTQVRPGEEVLFTIEVSNRGQIDLRNAQITDDVPEYLEILNVETTQGTRRWEGQRVVVDIGLIGPGFSVTILIHTRVREDAPAPLTVENEAVVRSDNCPDSRARTVANVIVDPTVLLPPSGGPSLWWWLAACLGTGLVALTLALSRWRKAVLFGPMA